MISSLQGCNPLLSTTFGFSSLVLAARLVVHGVVRKECGRGGFFCQRCPRSLISTGCSEQSCSCSTGDFHLMPHLLPDRAKESVQRHASIKCR